MFRGACCVVKPLLGPSREIMEGHTLVNCIVGGRDDSVVICDAPRGSCGVVGVFFLLELF